MAGNHQSLIESNLLKREIDPVSAAVATNGVGVDMQGWDGVLFVISIGAGAFTKDAKAQSDTVSTFATAADITGAAITQLAAGSVNKVAVIDVFRPTNRFVRSVVTPGGATLISAVSIRYRATGRLPVTQDTDTAQVVKLVQN